MRKALGILLIILGIALAIYVGVYLMLYGGVVQIVNNINPLNAGNIALGVLRIVFSEIGAFPGVLMAYFGFAIVADSY